LTTLLGLVALIGLKPWEADAVEPHLDPLGFEMGVGDSVAVPSPAAAFVADAAVAPGRAKLVARQVARQGPGGPADGGPGVAPARAVAVAGGRTAPTPTSAPVSPAPAPASPAPEAQPVAAPAPEAPPAPAAGPIAAAGEGVPSSPGGPVTSGGGGFESCEGDEYVLTISFIGEEPTAAIEDEITTAETPVEILLQRFNSDGSVEDLELEGDLFDAQALLVQLTSEGNCVKVEIVPAEPAEPVSP
jgi:hypothetical protein